MSFSAHNTNETKKGKTIQCPLGREATFDDKTLWNHVTVVSTPKAGGGNRVWSCNYCNKKVTSSYSKVKAHLLKIPNQWVEGCKALSMMH